MQLLTLWEVTWAIFNEVPCATEVLYFSLSNAICQEELNILSLWPFHSSLITKYEHKMPLEAEAL